MPNVEVDAVEIGAENLDRERAREIGEFAKRLMHSLIQYGEQTYDLHELIPPYEGLPSLERHSLSSNYPYTQIVYTDFRESPASVSKGRLWTIEAGRDIFGEPIEQDIPYFALILRESGEIEIIAKPEKTIDSYNTDERLEDFKIDSLDIINPDDINQHFNNPESVIYKVFESLNLLPVVDQLQSQVNVEQTIAQAA